MKSLKAILITGSLTSALMMGSFMNSQSHHVTESVKVWNRVESKTYQLSHFTGLAVALNMDVLVDINGKEGLRIEGDAEAIKDLLVEVKGGQLIIKTRESWKVWNAKHANKKLKAFLSAKELNAITMSGSGKISVLDEIKSNRLAINISGSGQVIANTNVESLNCNISGSGAIALLGQADIANIVISGSGALKDGLKINELSAVISGSGHVKAKVDDTLNAVISGSGSIGYSGNPSINKKVSGSGRVYKF